MIHNQRDSTESVHRGVAFAALRHRVFRHYFVTNMLSMMADNIEHVISYWVIFQLFHSPALGGFAVISHWMPFLLFSMYFGALADRFDYRKIIQVSQFMFIGVTLAWGMLFITESLEIWHSMVLLVVHGLAGAMWGPASQLMIHEIIGPEHLQSAVRLNATSRYLGVLLGPAVGGGLMLVLGPSAGLIVNAVIYLPLILWLRTVPYSRMRFDAVRGRRVGWKDAFGLLSGVSGNRVILSMILLVASASLLVGNAYQAQMPEFAHDLGTDEAGIAYSALLAANAAGAVIGGILLEFGGLLRPQARTAIILASLWCLAIGLFAGATSYPVALALLLLAGIFNLAFLSMAQTLVQLLAPEEIRGRLIGVFIMAMMGFRSFSGFTVGVLGSFIGIHWSLGLSSGVLLVVTLAMLTLVRSVDRDEGPSAV